MNSSNIVNPLRPKVEKKTFDEEFKELLEKQLKKFGRKLGKEDTQWTLLVPNLASLVSSTKLQIW